MKYKCKPQENMLTRFHIYWDSCATSEHTSAPLCRVTFVGLQCQDTLVSFDRQIWLWLVWNGLNHQQLREKTCPFFYPFQRDKRLSLFSAGYMRLVWLNTEILCLFGSASETTAQPICWWCSVVCLLVLTAHTPHIFPVNIYLWTLTVLCRFD